MEWSLLTQRPNSLVSATQTDWQAGQWWDKLTRADVHEWLPGWKEKTSRRSPCRLTGWGGSRWSPSHCSTRTDSLGAEGGCCSVDLCTSSSLLSSSLPPAHHQHYHLWLFIIGTRNSDIASHYWQNFWVDIIFFPLIIGYKQTSIYSIKQLFSKCYIHFKL